MLLLFVMLAAPFIIGAMIPRSGFEIHYTPEQLAVAKRKMQERCDQERGKDHPLL